MDNPEILIILDTQHTGKKTARKTKMMATWKTVDKFMCSLMVSSSCFLLGTHLESKTRYCMIWLRGGVDWEFCLSKNNIHLNYCHLLFIKIGKSLLELDVQYCCTTSTWSGCYGETLWYISLLMAPLNVTIIQLDQCIL